MSQIWSAKRTLLFFLFVSILQALAFSQQQYDSLAVSIFKSSLHSGKAFDALTELTTNIGNRLSGSANATKAVAWAKTKNGRVWT
jgi:carboxypeptidase Q